MSRNLHKITKSFLERHQSSSQNFFKIILSSTSVESSQNPTQKPFKKIVKISQNFFQSLLISKSSQNCPQNLLYIRRKISSKEFPKYRPNPFLQEIQKCSQSVLKTFYKIFLKLLLKSPPRFLQKSHLHRLAETPLLILLEVLLFF